MASPRRSKPTKPILLARATFERLSRLHADAHCELDHRNPFELLVATVLSAQTTDVLVNKVTPDLFAQYPDAHALARADVADVERKLSRLGMFRQKAKNVVGLSRILVERHRGEVPHTLSELVELPGVGRKTANVVLGVAFGTPEGVVVDTHVQRVSNRLGWTRESNPEKIERDLMALFPRSDWDRLSHVLIFHGRRVCFARRPACPSCVVNDVCPCAFRAENVGRKAPRPRSRPMIEKGAAATGDVAGERSSRAAKRPSRDHLSGEKSAARASFSEQGRRARSAGASLAARPKRAQSGR